MPKVVANEIVDLHLKRLRARNRWYLSAGLTWLTLQLVAFAAGWTLKAQIGIGVCGLAYLAALIDHWTSIKRLRRESRG